MAYKRKPIYVFKNLDSNGVFNVPAGRVVLIEETGNGPKAVIKSSNNGLSISATAGDLLLSNSFSEIGKTNVLELDNTDPYSPSSVYHPATKGYVDTMASSAGGNVEITKGYEFTGNGSTTSFDCGSDDAYIPGSVDVYINGLQLNSTDYTAADGRNFTLTNLVPDNNDVIKLVAYGGADVYNKSQSDNIFLKLSGGTVSGKLTTRETQDTVYDLSGNVIDPANGMVQQIILGNDTTYSENIENGQIVLLNILNGSSFNITWPTIQWSTNSGTAPELNSVDTVILYKVHSILYGTHSGNA